MVVEGMATALPFHRLIVRDPAFTAEPFTVHTRWIETEWENTVQPYTAVSPVEAEAEERTTVVVEVGGKRLEVRLPAAFGTATSTTVPSGGPKPRRSGGKKASAAASGNALTAPMQGTIVKVVVANGDEVAMGDPIVVLEAMKMEQPLTAHKAGVVSGLGAVIGEVVQAGAVICAID
jgi:acetyl-CoA/propionyl-CoA carboxylase biotin carboxyl carrier protein